MGFSLLDKGSMWIQQVLAAVGRTVHQAPADTSYSVLEVTHIFAI